MALIELKNVSKSFKTYNGDFYALKNISLSFSSTGLVSIVGKSGSGKSTLLNILLGIEKVTNGDIFFNQKSIKKLSDKEFSKYHLKDVSMVFQHYNLFGELTSKQNIMLPLLFQGLSKKETEKRVDSLLKEFSIEYLANQKVKLMSGGEKQRVAILRALITSPKVILCDEPTGALDKENSILIMEMLKKLSKSILIILVSHSRPLVEQYSDRIVSLKDGKVKSDITINKCFNRNVKNKEVKYSSKWTKIFTKLNFKLNKKKNIFSTISCTIGFASIFLSFGFYEGSQTSQDNALKNNLAILHASASEKTFYDIDNSPLSYEKSVRPSLESLNKYLNDFDDLVFETNLSYAFPYYPYGSYLGETIESFQLVPIYDISLSSYGKELLVSGTPPIESIFEVIVNEEFVKLLNQTNDEIIDELFSISYSTSFSYATGDIDNPIIKDDYSFDMDLRISAVVKEFSFLNSPKIYYSYPAVKEDLEEVYLDNISEYFEEPVSIVDFIERAEDDDPVSSYSSEIFLTSIDSANRFFEIVEKLNEEESLFRIESTAYDIKQSYKTFIESFSTALFVFTIIAFIGVNFILGMISLSTFIENKKNSAILTCLGARNSSIQSIYLSENLAIVFIAILLSIGLSLALQLILNILISKSFALDNLITIPFLMFYSYPFGLPILLTIVASLFSMIFTLTPMMLYRHISLSDELRDE